MIASPREPVRLNRRTFLGGALFGVPGSKAVAAAGAVPMGLNAYCLRAMHWNDIQLIDYTAGLGLDAVFLQDSLDPERDDPAHWRKVRAYAADRRLHLETGVGVGPGNRRSP